MLMRKSIKIHALVALFMVIIAGASEAAAQIKWHNPLNAPAGVSYVQNQAWNEDGGDFCRLPSRAKDKVRGAVWDLSRNSAGLAVRFRTDARDINVKYKVSGGHSMPHMPATGVSGVDLYRCHDKGFCFGDYSFGDTIRYSYLVDRGAMEGAMEEYTLYLPLYNTVTFMEIGVPDGAGFEFVAASARKPLVLYGTSIAQGACASRPAMAWGNILARDMDMPLINLGFSGNGRLEPEVIDFINEIDAAAVILDCMPNIYDKTPEQVEAIVVNAVNQIRSKHRDMPIVLVDHAGYSNGVTNEKQYALYTGNNEGQARAFKKLKEAGDQNLYHIEHSRLNVLPDGIVDYVHPSDLGMNNQARAVKQQLIRINQFNQHY